MKRRGPGSKANWGQYGTMVGADGYEYEYEVERDDSSWDEVCSIEAD